MKGRVLIVAGSDSGGGAGIQADIKTVTALGGFAATAITALTAQNTEGVFGVHPVPTAFLAQQMALVLGDIGADCIKTGMLHSAEVVDTVVAALREHAPGVPCVIDPVMVAKGGSPLLQDSAIERVRRALLPLATVLTPNLPEAEVLTGQSIRDDAGALAAAQRLRELGARAVLLKGGHRVGPSVIDLLVTDGGIERIEAPRIETRSTHGTGCTLASAIATGIAQGLDLPAAVRRAHAYVRRALETAPGLGRGHGPLNHGHTVRPFGD